MTPEPWKPDTCPRCGGFTVYAVWNGDYDIVDCRDCSNGTIWVSPKDRLAAYPGGPFLGSWPGRYAELAGRGDHTMTPRLIDLNAERKRRAGLRAEREAVMVPNYCERCWHRPYLHRRGDADCGVCGCPAGGPHHDP